MLTIVVATMLATDAKAENYPWCAIYRAVVRIVGSLLFSNA